MKPEEATLLESITATARELPRSVVEELCDALETLPGNASPKQRAALPGVIASQRARARTFGLIEAWSLASSVSPASLAWALRAASEDGQASPS